jgi:hypothetical protein
MSNENRIKPEWIPAAYNAVGDIVSDKKAAQPLSNTCIAPLYGRLTKPPGKMIKRHK